MSLMRFIITCLHEGRGNISDIDNSNLNPIESELSWLCFKSVNISNNLTHSTRRSYLLTLKVKV